MISLSIAGRRPHVAATRRRVHRPGPGLAVRAAAANGADEDPGTPPSGKRGKNEAAEDRTTNTARGTDRVASRAVTGWAVDALMTAEPVFLPRQGQVDYTHIRYAPVLNAVVVSRGKVLLLQRGSGMRNYPNHWCGISGYLDDDQSVEDKAQQKMFEEAGITGDSILTMQRGTVLLQEAPDCGKSWLVVPVLVRVRDRRYRLDWESQAAGWFSMRAALGLPLLPGFGAVIAQYDGAVDRD